MIILFCIAEIALECVDIGQHKNDTTREESNYEKIYCLEYEVRSQFTAKLFVSVQQKHAVVNKLAS